MSKAALAVMVPRRKGVIVNAGSIAGIRAVLDRAFAAANVGPMAVTWLDVAELAAALHPEQHNRGNRSLDDWLARYEIDTASRHSAAGDALATAELLLRLRVVAAAQGRRGFGALASMARQHRWLGTS
jgi:DNA polymerase-3 subunit epsilon